MRKTWGIGIRRIELDAHRCQKFVRKITVKRALYCLIAKAVELEVIFVKHF